jgi:uncharacterized protein
MRHLRLGRSAQLFVVALIASLAALVVSGLAQVHDVPTLSLDATAYLADDIVTMTGRDFAAGQVVTLQVTHAGGGDEPGMGHEAWTTTVGADGTFEAVWSPRPDDRSGAQFVVTAKDETSTEPLRTAFSRVAVVSVDKGDYQPGETAVVTGYGFAPDELVTLQVTHVNGQIDGNGHDPFYTAADAEGNVTATWYVDPDDSLGSKFLLTGTGQASGVEGSATFWDAGAVSLTTLGATYDENFDTLANSGTTNTALPTGWDLFESGTNANAAYQAGTGSNNAGDTYSFGASTATERALGGLRSGSLVPTVGAQFTNNTGATITSITISYAGEQWRLGQNVTGRAADRLDFQISTDATSLSTGTWTDQNALDFGSPVLAGTIGALNGNAAANRTAISAVITSLGIPNGATFWIRWIDADLIPGADDGLAIDEFSLIPNGFVAPPTPSLTINDVTVNEGNSGTTVFGFTVALSSAAGPGGVTFDIATADNTAAAPGDYTAKSLGAQTIPAGGTTYVLSVLVNGDAVTEGDETFFVDVSSVTGATIGDASGTGTILNDDVDFCALPFTPIYQIQGNGLSAAMTGAVTTKGVVVGDFEGSTGQQGFYLQDAAGDGNPATSDGIFVFTGTNNLVTAGQVVRVTGFARERFNQTTLNGSNSDTAAVPAANVVNCGTGSVSATDVTMPFASATALERFEGMLVRFPQSLVIAEYFNYDRFGELVIALPLDGEPRPLTGTAIDAPGAAANARTLANSLRRITLDDGLGAQNPAVLRHPNGLPFGLNNSFRGGDTVTNTVGVLGYDFNVYRIQPTAAADYVAANPRSPAPEPVGGSLRVAAMNTLNFFLTLDQPSSSPLDNKCGPAQNVECRGADADQPLEFSRQRAKLLDAIAGLNADVVGLNELENTAGVDPLGDPNGIVAGLNAIFGPGTYAHINTGVIGTDAIRVGLIYKPAKVAPVGAFKVLDSTVDVRFIDTRNRPSLAQTFADLATGGRFTVAVNHLKSKGSACDADPDLGDGQGNCSQTRKVAAEALVDWLATDPTGSNDPDFIILGDLNSYAREESIDAIKAGADDIAGTSDDFTNLIATFQGPYAYSYLFDAQFGYLDHALANASLFTQVTGATEWHINSDEPDVLDYDTSFKPASQDALYEPNAFRSSDHDAVVVGLDLRNDPPTADAGGPYFVTEGASIALSAAGVDPDGTAVTFAWDLDGDDVFGESGETGQTVSFTGADGAATLTVRVKATDDTGLSTVDSATVTVANVAPAITSLLAGSPSMCGQSSSLTVSFTDPALANDTYTAVVTWADGTQTTYNDVTSGFVASHSYAAPGQYSASVVVIDEDGGTSAAASAGLVTNYTIAGGGILPPVGDDGTRVFTYNSTIPVKVRVVDCGGAAPSGAVITIQLTQLTGANAGAVIGAPISTSGADTAGVMRAAGDGQYIFNLATRPLPDPSAAYRITLTIVQTGQTIEATFRLRP